MGYKRRRGLALQHPLQKNMNTEAKITMKLTLQVKSMLINILKFSNQGIRLIHYFIFLTLIFILKITLPVESDSCHLRTSPFQFFQFLASPSFKIGVSSGAP